jgi:hypothetical protein
MSSEDIAGWKKLGVCSSELYSDEIGNSTIIKCHYELCVNVVIKSNIQSKTPLIVSTTRENIKCYKQE